MANWQYTLKCSKKLRDAINEDDDYGTLEALKEAFTEINEKFTEDFDEYELEDALAECDNQLDNLENYEDYDMTYDDVQDEINYILDKLYDTCDWLRIWIGI